MPRYTEQAENSKGFVMLSAFRTEYGHDENLRRHAWLLRKLDQLKLPYREANGVYGNERELSVQVIATTLQDVHNIVRLAEAFEQESVLRVDSVKRATLRFADGSTKSIGFWRKVDKAHAEQHDSFTEIDGGYYVAY